MTSCQYAYIQLKVFITQTHNQLYHMLPVHTWTQRSNTHFIIHWPPTSSGAKLTISVLTGVNITSADLPGTPTWELTKHSTYNTRLWSVTTNQKLVHFFKRFRRLSTTKMICIFDSFRYHKTGGLDKLTNQNNFIKVKLFNIIYIFLNKCHFFI